MYLNYELYLGLYGDSARIPEADFELYLMRSLSEISAYTNVPKDELDRNDMALCAFDVAEAIYEQRLRDGIKSENTDGYSVTYTEIDLPKLIRGRFPESIYRGIQL